MVGQHGLCYGEEWWQSMRRKMHGEFTRHTAGEQSANNHHREKAEAMVSITISGYNGTACRSAMFAGGGLSDNLFTSRPTNRGMAWLYFSRECPMTGCYWNGPIRNVEYQKIESLAYDRMSLCASFPSIRTHDQLRGHKDGGDTTNCHR